MRELPAAGRDPALRVIQAPIDELLKGNFDATASLEPGDIVSIPPSEVVFVWRATGASAFPFRQGMTLLEALAVAKALTSDFKIDGIRLLRQDPAGGWQEIKVDLLGIMNGAKKDFTLEPNDMIVVPSFAWPTGPRKLLDTPPTDDVKPCRGARPCLALLAPDKIEVSDQARSVLIGESTTPRRRLLLKAAAGRRISSLEAASRFRPCGNHRGSQLGV